MTIQKHIQFAKRFFLPVLLVSVLFVVSSYYWSTEMVHTDEQLYDVRHGFPLKFLATDFIMDNAYTERIYKLPQKMNSFIYFGNTTVIWPVFLFNILITQTVLIGILFSVYRIFPQSQKFFRLLLVKNLIIGTCFGFGVLAVIYLTQSFLSAKEPLSMEPPEGFDPSFGSRPDHSSDSNIIAESMFQEVVRIDPEREVRVEMFFTKDVTLENVRDIFLDSSITVEGFKHSAGSSSGGYGLQPGETLGQAIENYQRDHQLFHVQRTGMKENLRITSVEVYGEARMIQMLMDENPFVRSVEIREDPLL